jgi:hypothetical protein
LHTHDIHDSASLGVPDLTQLCHETREQCLEIVTDPVRVPPEPALLTSPIHFMHA